MGLLDPNWKYTHSTATDIRKTFERARRQLTKTKGLQGQQRPTARLSGSFNNVRRIYENG